MKKRSKALVALLNVLNVGLGFEDYCAGEKVELVLVVVDLFAVVLAAVVAAVVVAVVRQEEEEEKEMCREQAVSPSGELK